MNAKFCFIELRSAEDCSAALNLNGIPFMGQCLKISRPAKYAGPPTPALTWQENTAKLGLVPAGGLISMLCADASGTIIDPNTKHLREIFVGNTSPEMTEPALSELIGKALQMMGLSCSGAEHPVAQVRVNQRFAFVEFRTMEDAANALNLNGIAFMNVSLKLSRPSKYEGGAGINFFAWDDLVALMVSGELKVMTAGKPSRLLVLTNMLQLQDLQDEETYQDVIEDTK